MTVATRSFRSIGVALAMLVVAVAFCSGDAGAASAVSTQGWHTLRHPIDPRELTDMPFGTDSPWLQPWRSSLTTRPATSLLNAIGINFNVSPSEAWGTARLLHDSGFRRARIEIGWGEMSYKDPSQLADPAVWRPIIMAMRRNHLRPLILLNANSGGPGPATTSTIALTAPAAAGATTVSLAADSVHAVVPGMTGFDTLLPYPQRPGDIITAVGANGVATLSRPLPMALPSGPVSVTTLRYRPFAPPRLANGSPNPGFEQPLEGWLRYARGVAHFVRKNYGSSDFDIEVWNELTFGSAFLDETNYYSPVPDPGSYGSVEDALLRSTARVLHDPAQGLPGVKVGDGFSNEMPWPSGATVPPGTDAIDKHPYADTKVFPASPQAPGIKLLTAQGTPDYGGGTATNGQQIQPPFIPSYRVFMPEYFLTGTQTETLMRDLSPITTSVHGTPHGARTHPPGSPPPKLWITEANLDSGQAIANGLPASDLAELQAKAALRYYVSYAAEGATAIDLYAAKAGCCQIIPPAFFNAIDAHPASYPASLAGLTMRAVSRLTSSVSGAAAIDDPRQLTLMAISQQGNDAQFAGNGTAGLPSLYNRDVLAFFPFQVSANRFVSDVYVMSRDLTHIYTSHPAHGATPYDMPPEQFRLQIGNVDGNNASASLTDPLTGARIATRIVARTPHSITVQLPVTDSPRMLEINDGSSDPLLLPTLVILCVAVFTVGVARYRSRSR